MAASSSASDDRPYWDEKLETLPRAAHKARRVEDRRQHVWS